MLTALVFGCRGALGAAVTATFVKNQWNVVGVDVRSLHQAIGDCTTMICVDPQASIEALQSDVLAASADRKYDAIVNVAGGWAGGSAADASTAAATELMLRQSVWTSTVAAHLAAVKGAPGSLLLLTGSAAALGGTAGMLGYGLAKAAVHHIVKSLAADAHFQRHNICVVGALPTTLDTKGNRDAMPQADRASWTPLDVAAGDIFGWAAGENRPPSGSLVVWNTDKGNTVRSIRGVNEY